MGSMVVVVVPPVFDDDLGFQQRVEPFDGQQLVAEPATEGLDIGILPGGAGFDVAGGDRENRHQSRMALAVSSGRCRFG